jgi:PilZ domain
MSLERDDIGRRAPRTPTHLDGSLLGRSRRGVTIVELSPTGCLALCNSAPDRGAILDLELEIEGGPFVAKVRVSQSSVEGASPPEGPPRYLTGLEFLALPAQDEARLRRFLEEQRRRKGADALPQ